MMIPSRMTFQWHLTDQCNYRCKHCYQSDYQNRGVGIEQLKQFYFQLENFVKTWKNSNPKFVGHINFTGGEPFLKEGIFDLLQFIKERKYFSFGILSNGLLIPDENLKKLKDLKPGFIQLSMEGDKPMNDFIRGKGAFQQVISAIKRYKKTGIPVMISFTANAKNYQFFPEVIKIARIHKVDKVWADRYLPFGGEDDLCMSASQTKEFFQLMDSHKTSLSSFISKTEVSTSRALQFLICGGQPYQCSAGKSLLTVMPDGTVFPCRRLPLPLGNLGTNDLMDIFQNNQVLKDLRNPELLDKDCGSCFYKASCQGGLKCLSFARYGEFNRKDPDCWI